MPATDTKTDASAEARTCPRCGSAQLQPRWRVCPDCLVTRTRKGAAIEAAEEAAEPATTRKGTTRAPKDDARKNGKSTRSAK